MKKAACVAILSIAIVIAFTPIGALAVSLPECITNSQDANTIIRSAPCGVYRIVSTRQENAVGDALDVTVKYMIHPPLGAPKALVMLFAGGAGNTGIQGDAITGVVTNAGNNFLVRSAQLFAEDGYLTVTIDRPSVTVGFNGAEFDQYRVAPAHAQDIVAVLNDVNALYATAHLPLFLAGTSRGAISIVAQNMLGIGSLPLRPVTLPGADPESLWVGANSPHPRLRPQFVSVPVQVFTHQQDGCLVSTPTDSFGLHVHFLLSGVVSFFNSVNGGFEVNPDPCEATTHHGFLGIEQKAAQKITAQMNLTLKFIKLVFPGNTKPQAASASVATLVNTPITVNLAPLTSDANGNSLRYSLPHPTSSRGGVLQIKGSVVRYTPPTSGVSNITDGFVYTVSDGKGGKTSAIISVKVN